MKGGVLLGVGTGAMVFASTRGWDFIPAPVGSIPPPPPGLGPGDIVAHVTKTEDGVTDKNLLVQGLGSADPYVKMLTNPSIGAYDVKTDAFLGAFVHTQENLISGSSAAMTLYNEWAGVQPPLTCSLMVRYNNVAKSDLLSLVDIMIGLVHIDGRFVHGDLHDNNFGVMRDGCPIISDYDRVRTDGIRLSMYIDRYILINEYDYPWFADVLQLYKSIATKLEKSPELLLGQLMKIFDLLTVLYFVDAKYPKFHIWTKATREWIGQNWESMTQQALHERVSALGQMIGSDASGGKTWRPMSMDAERAMAAEYNARPQPARNTPGLWAATRNHYRFGAS